SPTGRSSDLGEADELRAVVERIGRQGVGGSSLTTAELRILPLLATHLTFREIAQRLYLLPFTVQTRALTVRTVAALTFPAPGPTSIDSLVTGLVRILPGLFGWFWEISYDLLLAW